MKTVNTFLESTISSELKYHYLIMIGRKGERRNGVEDQDSGAPRRSVDACAAAAEPCRAAYAALRHPPAPGSDPMLVPPHHISYHSADLQMRHQKLCTLVRHFSVGHFA